MMRLLCLILLVASFAVITDGFHISIPLDTPRTTTTQLTAHYSSRRQIFTTAAAALIITTTTAATTALPVRAAETSNKPTPEQALQLVRRELETGGVVYMQKCIDQQDFGALLDFTKTYDQILRKQYMGVAAKGLQGDVTALKNAVTFDLIGINRSSRPGQESVEQANKYLEELRTDVRAFLALEPKATDE